MRLSLSCIYLRIFEVVIFFLAHCFTRCFFFGHISFPFIVYIFTPKRRGQTKALGTWQPAASGGYGYAGMQAHIQALTSRANTYLTRHLYKPDDLFKCPKNHR